MKISKNKLYLAMANECINPFEFCDKAKIQYQTYRRIIAGGECKPATVGKIAKVLNCSVPDLLEE